MEGDSPKKVWRTIDIIRWGQDYFATKSFSSPRLLIELLLCRVLNCKRIDLYLSFERPLKNDEIDKLKKLILQVLQREPLQYVIEETQFLDFTLKVRKGVFIPRPETELLVVSVRKDLSSKANDRLEILDIGCGSGAISIALAKYFPNSNVLAVDISDIALEVAKENSSTKNIYNISFRRLDILREIPESKFDLIVSNPPYIPFVEVANLDENVKKEPLEALTDFSDGLMFYRRFADVFPLLLKDFGKFYLEVGYGQAKSVKELFEKSGFVIEFHTDYQNIKRIITNIIPKQ
ncbi:MAG: peptide chain release factor N(5)-glutamine methyltransferase [Candidatus Kapaibacteriales bacterium]